MVYHVFMTVSNHCNGLRSVWGLTIDYSAKAMLDLILRNDTFSLELILVFPYLILLSAYNT